MEYLHNKKAIQIGAKGLQGLYQEINTLLSTRKGTVPLDRDFGVSWDFIDSPINEARPLIVAELVTQIEKYIPRIKVTGIDFENQFNLNGKLFPKITFEIREEYKNEFIS